MLTAAPGTELGGQVMPESIKDRQLFTLVLLPHKTIVPEVSQNEWVFGVADFSCYC